MPTQPNHLNWIPVDPNNLPDGEVLALNEDSIKMVGYLMIPPEETAVGCLGAENLRNITHYVPLDEIPMPGGNSNLITPEDRRMYLLMKGLVDPTTPSLDELKARAQDVADRFNKKYGLSHGNIGTMFGLDVWDNAQVEVDDDPKGMYQVYVRILGANVGAKMWHYIYCADTDSFIDRFQGCLDH